MASWPCIQCKQHLVRISKKMIPAFFLCGILETHTIQRSHPTVWSLFGLFFSIHLVQVLLISHWEYYTSGGRTTRFVYTWCKSSVKECSKWHIWKELEPYILVVSACCVLFFHPWTDFGRIENGYYKRKNQGSLILICSFLAKSSMNASLMRQS